MRPMLQNRLRMQMLNLVSLGLMQAKVEDLLLATCSAVRLSRSVEIMLSYIIYHVNNNMVGASFFSSLGGKQVRA